MRACVKVGVLEKQEHVNVRRRMLENIAVNLKAVSFFFFFFKLDCEVTGAKTGLWLWLAIRSIQFR